MDMEHERRLTEVEQQVKSNSHRIGELEKRQDNLDELVSTVKVLAVKEENVETKVEEISTDVKSLASKPGKRWDGIVEKAILTIITAGITYAMAKFGIF